MWVSHNDNDDGCHDRFTQIKSIDTRIRLLCEAFDRVHGSHRERMKEEAASADDPSVKIKGLN